MPTRWSEFTLTPESAQARQAAEVAAHHAARAWNPTGARPDSFRNWWRATSCVTNAKNVYGPQIADHAFAFLLALTRKLNVSIPRQQLEEWPAGRDGMFELNGKTAVIIGVGGIGSQIAQRAHGFGMKVIGVDIRDVPTSNMIQRVVPPGHVEFGAARSGRGLRLGAAHRRRARA